jgi:hypothetical protein
MIVTASNTVADDDGWRRPPCPSHQIPMDEPFLLGGYRNGRMMCPECRKAYMDRLLPKVWEHAPRVQARTDARNERAA